MKQIALFIIPYVLLVVRYFEVRLIQLHFHSIITILAWILGKPLTLLLDPFQSIVLFLSGQAPHLRHAMA